MKKVTLATTGTQLISGLQGYATGWGQTNPSIYKTPDRLQYVVLPLISLRDCKEYYGNDLTERMFCAGYPAGGKDTCQVQNFFLAS